MKIINGFKFKNNIAKVFTNNIEESAENQIKEYLDLRISKDQKIRIMPDVHAGSGCVIGFTATLNDYIVPNLVGVDIGCGVTSYNLGKVDIDLQQLDNIIREKIPSGFEHRKKPILTNHDPLFELVVNLIEYKKNPNLQLATLGGGNHFIELGVDSQDNKWLTVHSGSRNFGLSVAKFFQNQAEKLMKAYNINMPKGLEFLHSSDKNYNEYLNAVEVCTKFALYNRRLILNIIVKQLSLEVIDMINSTHNYIDTEQRVIRKGAIDASLDKPLLIPFNMRDGILIGKGKGNVDWNQSAPHGAGRIMSRKAAKSIFNLEDYKHSMNGVFSTCINNDTIDEAPMAYKPFEEIKEAIKDTVEIIDIIKPIYNFKASE